MIEKDSDENMICPCGDRMFCISSPQRLKDEDITFCPFCGENIIHEPPLDYNTDEDDEYPDFQNFERFDD
jgi:hypothetical protein